MMNYEDIIKIYEYRERVFREKEEIYQQRERIYQKQIAFLNRLCSTHELFAERRAEKDVIEQ